MKPVRGSLRNMARRAYRAIPFKRQLFDSVRGRVPLPHSIYQHLHFTGPFRVQVAPNEGFQMFSEGFEVENDLFWAGYGGGWEAVSLRAWAALCRDQDDLILDIGANTGVYALAAAALSPAAEVVAFEPVERVADRLARNVALNDFSIAIERKAVSGHSGRVPIFDVMLDHNYSASLEGQGPGAASYEVEVVSLDDWLLERPANKVSAIKIDVERHEPAVLRGMRRLLAAQQPPMLVEILDEAIGAEVEGLVAGLGYRTFEIHEKRGLKSTDRLERPSRTDRNHLLCTAADFERAGLASLMAE